MAEFLMYQSVYGYIGVYGYDMNSDEMAGLTEQTMQIFTSNKIAACV